MQPRHFLFDLDGTLVDSAPLHEAAFRATIGEFAPAALAAFRYEAVKGLATRAALRWAGIEDSVQLERCIAQKQRLYRESIRLGALRAYSGARELLQMIKAGGGRNFVVSSGSRESVGMALASAGIADLLAGVIDADQTREGKPAPDPYLTCLDRYQLRGRDSIALEDAPAGVESARAAGIRVIGVHNPEVRAVADVFYDDLPSMIEGLRLRLGLVQWVPA